MHCYLGRNQDFFVVMKGS